MKWMKETKESDEMSLRCKGKKKGSLAGDDELYDTYRLSCKVKQYISAHTHSLRRSFLLWLIHYCQFGKGKFVNQIFD